jgi:hypothetical protein
MKAHNEEVIMKNDHESRITRLEVTIENINCTLSRIENRLDRMDTKIDSNFKWVIGLYISGFAGLLTAMSHGFHWL